MKQFLTLQRLASPRAHSATLENLLHEARQALKQKLTKKEFKKIVFALNVLLDAPLAMFKTGTFCNLLLEGTVNALDINAISDVRDIDFAEIDAYFSLYVIAIVVEYISLYRKKGKIQEVIPRIREASEKGLFVYNSLTALSALILSRIETDMNPHEMNTIKASVFFSTAAVSLILGVLSGVLMLDKTRMPLTAPSVEAGSKIKSDKVRHALEYGRIFIIASGTMDLLIIDMQKWCAGGNFMPFWCDSTFDPIAIYLTDLLSGVIGMLLFAFTQHNEKYRQQLMLTSLAISTICWGNWFLGNLGYMVESYKDYTETVEMYLPPWANLLAFIVPFFMAFVRVLQLNERFQHMRQVTPSIEMEELDSSNEFFSEKSDPGVRPLLEIAHEDDLSSVSSTSRTSSEHSEPSVATPPPSPPSPGNAEASTPIMPSLKEEALTEHRLSAQYTLDKSSSAQQEQKKAGRVSQLGMYATGAVHSLGSQTRQTITSFGSWFHGTRSKPSDLNEGLLSQYELV